ncbi:Chlorovirus glycoprotein repeat domain-containing protein [Paramecium bursaria Chlorella virus NW665.2]|nr:Chlorovirus glycoprotein repeat domain-containing protein [Paramecium bursaria Chlorella virus NW665.2]
MSSAQFRTYINKLAGINTETGDYDIFGNVIVEGNGSIIRGASNLSPISTTDISGNLIGNFISVSGNVETRSGVFIGNGALLTGTASASLPKTIVADIMGNIYGNSAAMTGNISASYFFGDGSGLTGLVTFIPRSGNINIQGNIFATGNVDASNISAGLLRAQGNLIITDSLSATGNLSALYLKGIGSNIIGINASPPPSANLDITGNVLSRGNVDAANVTVASSAIIGNMFVSGSIAASGNISAAYLFGNASNVRATIVPNTISTNVIGNVTANGNVRADYFIGNAFNMFFSGNLITIQGNVANQAARLALTGVPLGGLVTQTDDNSQYLLAYQPPSANASWVPLAGTNFPVTSAFGRQGAVVLISGIDVKTLGGTPIVGNGDIRSANIDITRGNVIGNIQTTLLSAGNVVSNILTFTGQVTAPTANLISNVFIGNGFYLVGTPASIPATGNIDIQGNVVSYGTVNASNISTGTLRITNGNLNIANQVTVGGNVSADFFYGNGSFLVNANVGNASGIIATNIIGNVSAAANVDAANVFVDLLRVNANTHILGQLQTTGNIAALFLVGNGFTISGITTASGTQNVNITGNVFATGNVDATNVSANSIVIVNGNVIFGGQVNVIGNVVATSFIGDGSNLSGLRASGLQRCNLSGNVSATGNVDSGNILANVVGVANVVVSGQVNVTGGNVSALGFIGNGSTLTGVIATLTGTRNINISGNVSAPGNVNASNVSANLMRVNANADVYGQVIITGNATANYFIGNGLGVTNTIVTGLQNINIIGNVLSRGNVEASNISANLMSINGNIQVSGQVNTTNRVTANYLLGNGVGIINVVASSGVPASFVQPGSGFLSNTANIITYGVLPNAWLIILSVSTPRFITIITPTLPPNTTAPFTTLPANVSQSIANAWVFTNGTWQGTYRLSATSTITETSNNFIFNYHTSYGAINGLPSETFCRVVA